MKTGAIVHGSAIRARLTALLAAPRGVYLPISIGTDVVGWVDEARAAVLASFEGVFVRHSQGLAFVPTLDTASLRTSALDPVVETLARENLLTAWRDERYAIATRLGAPPLCLIERAAARFFGVRTYAAHVNGLVRGEPVSMWLARRSPHKAIDPGMLDNLVGGGIRADATIADTMVREAWEEAGIPAEVARTATLTGELRILRAQPDGLQRETVFVHDLWLEAGFIPSNQDGEAVEHRLLTLDEAASLVANLAEPEVVTVDASLVIVDFLLRNGAITASTLEGRDLGALRYSALDPLSPRS